MILERVMKYIRKNEKTIVYLFEGRIKCTPFHKKFAGTVFYNKKKLFQIAGVYTRNVPAEVVAGDLAELGVRE
jgi:hypothetical protein